MILFYFYFCFFGVISVIVAFFLFHCIVLYFLPLANKDAHNVIVVVLYMIFYYMSAAVVVSEEQSLAEDVSVPCAA